MPKIIAELSFELNPDPQDRWRHQATIRLPSLAVYHRLKQSGFSELWFRENVFNGFPAGKLKAAFPIDSPEWLDLKNFLCRELRLTEKKSSCLNDDELDVHYAPRMCAEYSKQELSNSAYLRLLPFWGKEIGYLDHQTEDERYVAALDRRQKNKHQFGVLFPTEAIAFADPLKSQIEQAGLQHLRFESIMLVEQRLLDERQRLGPDAAVVMVPAPASKILKPLWKLTSHVVLPRFLYPLTQGNSPFNGDLAKGCGYDNGNSGLGLKYRRDDIALLEPFDVAVTTERLGIHKDHCFRSIIVSQKFRRTMIKLGVKAAEYEPVILE